VYTAPGLLATDGVHLSQRGKRILGHELAGLIERALKGEWDITQLTRDEPRHGMPVPGVRLTAQLKCTYTHACSMGNKQEELEAIIQQDSYDLVAITEK